MVPSPEEVWGDCFPLSSCYSVCQDYSTEPHILSVSQRVQKVESTRGRCRQHGNLADYLALEHASPMRALGNSGQRGNFWDPAQKLLRTST